MRRLTSALFTVCVSTAAVAAQATPAAAEDPANCLTYGGQKIICDEITPPTQGSPKPTTVTLSDGRIWVCAYAGSPYCVDEPVTLDETGAVVGPSTTGPTDVTLAQEICYRGNCVGPVIVNAPVWITNVNQCEGELIGDPQGPFVATVYVDGTAYCFRAPYIGQE